MKRRLAVGVVLVSFLAFSALASGRVSASWWTIAQVRALLLSPGSVLVTDVTQPDRPDYELRFGSARALKVTPIGQARMVKGKKRWRLFAVTGTAHDLPTDQDLSVSFTFRPTGPSSYGSYAITGFRGPPPDNSQPSFPIRGAFVYAWYPEGWTQFGIYPFSWYRPSLGYYDSGDPAVVREQIAALRYGNINVGLYSWWKPGTGNNSAERFPLFLRLARQTPLRWAITYEGEGYGDPSVDEIRADLTYFRDNYVSKPAYLKIDGHFLVFVYADAADGCGMADRWKQANAGIGAYIVLKAFGGYRDCASQPDSWYQYTSNVDESSIPPPDDYVGPLQSFMASPGFNARDSRGTTRARNLDRWRQNVQHMVDSHAPWQLIITFNEWAEGTAVESGTEWETPSGYGAYLDALHEIK